MASILPFKALRPQAQFARLAASRPYDVLNTHEAKVEAQGNPYSFLHITRSEIDLPEETDPHSSVVYEKAKENLQAYLQRNVLFQEDKACYYIYRLIMNGRSQTGLVCVSSVKDYEKDIIRKHELTRPEKENDRIQHILTTGAQTGNVFLAYRDVENLNVLIEKWKNDKSPIYDFQAEDGIAHSIWIVNDDATIQQITSLFQEEVPCTYIADGHHRAASAAKVKKSLGQNASPAAGYFLTTLFPASELAILDYNRIIKDLNGHSPDNFLKALESDFQIVPFGEKAVRPAKPHEFGRYLNCSWYQLLAKEETYSTDPIGILDVTILSKNILEKHLSIKDQRTDTRIDFVGGIRGLEALKERVDSGEMQVAFSLFPVSMDQLFSIADNNMIMPPKSTWFEPKLRDGLLTHLINGRL